MCNAPGPEWEGTAPDALGSPAENGTPSPHIPGRKFRMTEAHEATLVKYYEEQSNRPNKQMQSQIAEQVRHEL